LVDNFTYYEVFTNWYYLIKTFHYTMYTRLLQKDGSLLFQDRNRRDNLKHNTADQNNRT